MLTLGLFLLVINGLMIELVAYFLPGFVVAGFWSAIFAAIVVSLTSWVMSGWIGPRGRVEVVTMRRSAGAGSSRNPLLNPLTADPNRQRLFFPRQTPHGSPPEARTRSRRN